MVNTEGEIQDLLTDMGDDTTYIEGAYDFEEWTIIDNDDIEIINDIEALWAAVIGCLKTPQGYIDGVTLENYGSKLLSLRGMPLDWHIAELAKTYIRETIPQFQGYVLNFPTIEIDLPTPETSERFSMKIDMTMTTIFGGPYRRVFYL